VVKDIATRVTIEIWTARFVRLRDVRKIPDVVAWKSNQMAMVAAPSATARFCPGSDR
jgi:hypothetical protein